MKRAERQYALVDLLRGARRPLSVARLAREFGVSTRTVERDIASLQVAGVPLYADHGAAGGYSILREYSLPPLNLTAAESLAVLAGLGLLDSSPYQSAARRARAKIEAVLPDEHRTAVQQDLAAVRVVDTSAESAPDVPLALLSDVIAARRVVRITYAGGEVGGSASPVETVRNVECTGLLRGGDAWLLVGWCRLREGFRGFRIEAIRSLDVLDEVAPPRDPALLEADQARWATRPLG